MNITMMLKRLGKYSQTEIRRPLNGFQIKPKRVSAQPRENGKILNIIGINARNNNVTYLKYLKCFMTKSKKPLTL